jgi:HK97 family phage portal protein
MAILDGLLKFLGIRKSRASRLLGQMSIPFAGGYLSPNWLDNRYLQVQAYKEWVYIAVRTLMQSVAQLSPEVAVVRQAERDRQKACWHYKGLNRLERRKALVQLANAEDLDPLPLTHPLWQLLRHPNESDSFGDFMSELVLFLQLTGNAYLWCPPAQAFDYPAEMWILPSHWVFPRASKDGGVIDHYEIRPVYSSVRVLDISADEIIHLKYKSALSKIDGWASTTAGARFVDNSAAIEQSRWHMFSNLALLGPMLLLDEQTQDVGPEDIERVEQRFMSRFSGPTKAGRPVILRGVKDIKSYNGNTPVEMAYSESSEQARDYILALFGVPKQVAGFGEGMTYGSNIAVLQWYCGQTINPLTSKLGSDFTRHLAPRFPEGHKLRVYYQDCTPADPQQQLAENTAYLDRGVITINEMRQELGRDKYPFGGDDPIMPVGSAPMPFVTGDDLQDMDFVLPRGADTLEDRERQEQMAEQQLDSSSSNNRLEAALRNGHMKGGWNESDHPRDDSGRFSSGGGGGGSAGSGGGTATAPHTDNRVFSKPKRTTVRDSKLHPSDEDLPAPMMDYFEDLNKEEKVAIRQYTEEAYTTINEALRRDEEYELDDEHQDIVSDLRSAIRKAGTLPEPITVWRGVQLSPIQLAALKAQLTEGATIEMPGFTSTSLNPSISTEFAGAHEGSLIFEIEAQQGMYFGAMPDPSGLAQMEREFLLRDSSRFAVGKTEIVKFRNADGKLENRQIVHLRQIKR